MKKTKPFKIQCGCGCLLTRDQLVTIRLSQKGKIIHRLRCEEHKHLDKAEILHRITACDKCGNDFEYHANCGVPPYHCKICKPIEAKKRNRKYAAINSVKNKELKIQRKEKKKRTPYPINKKNGDPERWMCKHWDGKCYDLAIKHNLTTRPCKGCKEFEAKAQNHDPLFSRYSAKDESAKPARRRR